MGLITKKYWLEIPNHFNNIKLDRFIVMPNHLHGIIHIIKNQFNVPRISKFGHVIPKSISTIIGSYKSVVTKNININLPNSEFAWQSRFHDRIIRNQTELQKIRQYIINNPKNWKYDRNKIDLDYIWV